MRGGGLTTFIIQLQQTASSNCINYTNQVWSLDVHVNALTVGYLVDALNYQLNYSRIIYAMSFVTLDHWFYGTFHNALWDTWDSVVEMCTRNQSFHWLSILKCTSEQIIALIRDTCRLESWNLFDGICRAIFNFIRLHYGLECEHWNLQQNLYQDLFILLSNMTLNYSTLWKQCSGLSASFGNTQYNLV